MRYYGTTELDAEMRRLFEMAFDGDTEAPRFVLSAVQFPDLNQKQIDDLWRWRQYVASLPETPYVEIGARHES
jgi:hypothetical protein